MTFTPPARASWKAATQLYPTADCDAGCVTAQTNRFKPGAPVHPQDVGGQPLSNEEYYLLILSTDAGGQFYSRENAPSGMP